MWAAAHAPRLDELDQPDRLRTLLDSLARKQNGEAASYNYFTRRRAVLHNALHYAVAQGHLATNPLDDARLDWEQPSILRPRSSSDPRSVGNPRQVESMLTAVSYIGTQRGPHMVAFFATIYYAMLRPSEAIDLRHSGCDLPETGWGTIIIDSAAPCVDRHYTDTGKPHDLRGLKHRASDEARTVPIPPRLVELLRNHLDRFGTAPDGRLFRTRTGKRLDATTYRHIWNLARNYGLNPTERHTPRLKRPYDLRHSGISLRLTASIPPRQVAAWAGNSAEVLERTYSKTLEGYDTRWQNQLDELLDQ